MKFYLKIIISLAVITALVSGGILYSNMNSVRIQASNSIISISLGMNQQSKPDVRYMAGDIDVTDLNIGDSVESVRTATSKTTLVEKTEDKSKGTVTSAKFAIDSSIGVQSYKDGTGKWLDCNPQWLVDRDGWHSEGTEILAYIYIDGSRLIYPNRYDQSKYIQLGTFEGFKDLRITLRDSTTLVMADKWGEFRFILSNSGVHFETYFMDSPPFEKIVFPVESVGYDIDGLLKAKDGIGIPQPYLTEDIITGEPKAKPLEWAYDGKQLELGFDLSGLKFPILLKNTTLEVRVGASADDVRVFWDGSNWQYSHTTATGSRIGYYSSTVLKSGAGFRFQNITIPQGSEITTAYIVHTAKETNAHDNVNSVIIGEDVDNAAAFSNLADYQARRGTIVGGANDNYLTSASVNWNAVAHWTGESTYNSPEIKTIAQEIVNRLGWASGNSMVLFWGDHAGNSTAANYTDRLTYAYDNSTTKCPLLHAEYTPPISISNTPDTEALGTLAVSTTYYAGSQPANPVAAGTCTFTVTNSGSQCDLDMKIADFTGGVGWNIAASNPGANEVTVTAYYVGQNPASGLVLANTDAEFYDALAASATLVWDFSLLTGSSFTDGVAKSATLTITGTAED
jgi:hypothetical protein